jgi:membrane protease YdiL (CAAX protease family)
VDAQLYFLLFIPLAYLADRRVFSSELWTATPAIFAFVPVAAVAQLVAESTLPPMQPANSYDMIAAILLAPFVEELVRAVMMLAFTEKLGTIFAVVLTASLTAAFHAFFWIALLTQTILCIVFVKSRRSLPTVMASHLAINVIAVLQVRFQSFGLH